MPARAAARFHECETLDKWVPEFIERIGQLPYRLREPSKLWFCLNQGRVRPMMASGDYVGGIQTVLLKNNKSLPSMPEDAAGRCIGVPACAVLPTLLGQSEYEVLTPSVRLCNLLVPYDAVAYTWSHLRRLIGDEHMEEFMVVLKRTLVAMRPMLLMHYSAAEHKELDDDDELLDDLVDRFKLEIAWNQFNPNSVAAGGVMPWLMDVSIVGWFGEQEFGTDKEMCDGFMPQHPVHLPFCGEIAETIRPHFSNIMDMVRNEIIGLVMDPTITGKIDWFLTYCKSVATQATIPWNGLSTTSIPIPITVSGMDQCGGSVSATNDDYEYDRHLQDIVGCGRPVPKTRRPVGHIGKSVGKPMGSGAVETEEQREARLEANRQMIAKLSSSGGVVRRQPAKPLAPKSSDQAAGLDINQARLDAFYEQETLKHKAESEAQRRVRKAAEAEKARKAKQWAPSVIPGASGPSRGWVEEDPGESERAKRHGKKVVKLQAHKEAIAKRRAEEAAIAEKQRKIVEKKLHALKIGEDMMREQREPVQPR